MIIGAWNVRGLNGLLTQDKTANLAWQYNISIFGLLVTKLRTEMVQSFMHARFGGWEWCSNLDIVDGGRILVIWNPNLIECTPLDINA